MYSVEVRLVDGDEAQQPFFGRGNDRPAEIGLLCKGLRRTEKDERG